MIWCCIYVKSRHEFKVQEKLSKEMITSFLPTIDRLRKWKDRKKMVTFPLFPGYLFINLDENIGLSDQILKVVKTPGVVNILKNELGMPIAVPEKEIINLKNLVKSNQEIDPYPYLKEGQMVRIMEGALKGVSGILLKKENADYVVVTIEILKRSVCVKIDPSNIEKI